MTDLHTEEQRLTEGYTVWCGVDEAGRGPLAGPVCAGAVILPRGLEIEGLNDSKKLSEKKRDVLFDVICREAVSYGIGWASHEEIDSLNILQATFLAMRRAVSQLSVQPQRLLVDGNRDPGILKDTVCVVGGDGKCVSIAAASVLAKVSRDRYMLELDEQFPEYGFRQHKGYPTRLHYDRLQEYGPSPVHRMTFLRKMH